MIMENEPTGEDRPDVVVWYIYAAVLILIIVLGWLRVRTFIIDTAMGWLVI